MRYLILFFICFIAHADYTKVLPISRGGTNNSSSYTAGSVLFSSGTSVTQDNANFFWDSSAHRLGIGTVSPTKAIEVVGVVKATTFSGSGSSLTGVPSSAVDWTTPGAIGVVTPNTGSFTSIKLQDGSAGSPTLAYNNESSTGFYRKGSGQLAYVTSGADKIILQGGSILLTDIKQIGSGSNATITPSSTGTTITRDVADANVSLIVQQINASSTGDIFQLKNSASTVLKVTNAGHLISGGSAPAVSSCGTSPSITGNDIAGVVTIGTGGTATACTLTFAIAYGVAPHCFTNDRSEIVSVSVSATSTTAITISKTTPFAASSVIDYYCIQ